MSEVDYSYIHDINKFDEIFEHHNNSSKPVVVEFYSSQCKHCNDFRGVYESLAQKHRDAVDFYRINLTGSEEKHNHEGVAQAKECRIQHLPTIMAFKGDQITCENILDSENNEYLHYKARVGNLPEDEFDTWLNEVREEYAVQRKRHENYNRHNRHRHRVRL